MARIERAGEALAKVPLARWSNETLDLFQVLLEVHGEIAAGLPRARYAVGVGVRTLPPQPPELRDFATVREAAREIGVLPLLEAGGMDVWRMAQ